MLSLWSQNEGSINIASKTNANGNLDVCEGCPCGTSDIDRTCAPDPACVNCRQNIGAGQFTPQHMTTRWEGLRFGFPIQDIPSFIRFHGYCGSCPPGTNPDDNCAFRSPCDNPDCAWESIRGCPGNIDTIDQCSGNASVKVLPDRRLEVVRHSQADGCEFPMRFLSDPLPVAGPGPTGHLAVDCSNLKDVECAFFSGGVNNDGICSFAPCNFAEASIFVTSGP